MLKIDKQFVDLIPDRRDDGQIVSVIIDLGHTLGLKVLAEGVEMPAQLDFLREQGCDLYQGFLASEPLDGETFETRYLNT